MQSIQLLSDVIINGFTFITSLKFVSISLHLFRIVTSVMPARLDISICRRLKPSNTAARYMYAAARPLGALPSPRRLSFVLCAMSIANLSTLMSIFAVFASLDMY
jgi:hypothetical protein